MDDHRWPDGSGYQIGRCTCNTKESGESEEQRISEERTRDPADEYTVDWMPQDEDTKTNHCPNQGCPKRIALCGMRDKEDPEDEFL